MAAAAAPLLPQSSSAHHSHLSLLKLIAAAVASLAALAVVHAAARRSWQQAAAPATVRLAVLSDTHVAGPEYALNGENGPLDNASITRTQQRLFRTAAALNAISPAPQASSACRQLTSG